MIATTNYTEGGTQTETYKVLRCSPSFLVGLQQQQSIVTSQHFLGIPSFLLPLARKLPFIRRPN